MQNVAEMEAMALWQMRPCWGADAAAAAPPRLVARGGVRGVCVSTGDPDRQTIGISLYVTTDHEHKVKL